jgi:hypothetical protein
MERRGNLSEASIKKNLKWFLEEKATGKITLSLGERGAAIAALINFIDGKPVNAQIGPEKGQRALSQILNYPSVGTYKIETEEAVPTPSLEEMPTIAPFARAAAPPAPAPPRPTAAPPSPAPKTAKGSGETLTEILRSLQRRDSQIQAAAIISKEGLIVTSVLPSGVPQERVAVTAASIVAQAQSATQDLVRGEFQDIFIRGEGGYICVTKAGESAYLLALAKNTAMLGSILLELRKVADEIAKEL